MIKPNSFLIIASTILLLSLLLLSEGCSYTQTQQENNVSQQAPDGYNIDDLNNYGEWVQVNNYGEAWRPNVVSDWMPFDNGYWDYSEGNWTWVSYEPFCWIVYHYGYWYNDPFYGWVWIPSDNQWSPARVQWIDYGNYIGWAPLPPPGVVYGVPLEARAKPYWQVVRKQDFDRENVGNFRVQNPVRNTMGGREVSIKPPARKNIESSTGRNVNEVNIPRETVRIQKREITKMKLPPPEAKKVEKNQERVRQKILLPRGKPREKENKQNKKRP